MTFLTVKNCLNQFICTRHDSVFAITLQIFDGDSETSPTVGGPLCGTSRPADIRTSIQNSTMVLVRFRSDAVNTTVEKGYSIYYYQVEPGKITFLCALSYI